MSGVGDAKDGGATRRALHRVARADEQVSGTVIGADLHGISVSIDGVRALVPRTECAHGLLRSTQVGAAWRGYVVEVGEHAVICSTFPRPSRVERSKRRQRFLRGVSLGSVVAGKVIGREPPAPNSPSRVLVLLYHEMVWGAIPSRPETPDLEEGHHGRFRIVAFADRHDRNLDVLVRPCDLTWRP